MHAVHHVLFTDRLSEGGDLQSFDALVFGPVHEGETLEKIYAIEGGVFEVKTSVPHGSAEQGYTWH